MATTTQLQFMVSPAAKQIYLDGQGRVELSFGDKVLFVGVHALQTLKNTPKK